MSQGDRVSWGWLRSFWESVLNLPINPNGIRPALNQRNGQVNLRKQKSVKIKKAFYTIHNSQVMETAKMPHH
jgi:hypothetical protein